MILSSPLDYPFIYNASSNSDPAVQRQAREFLQKREEDRRVENWVKSQVASNAFMLTAAQAYAQAQSASRAKSYSSKGHRRRRSSLSSSNRKCRSQDSIYLSSSLYDTAAPHLSTISELEEDAELEPYIFYSTPLPVSNSPSSPIDCHIISPIPTSMSMPLAAPKPIYPFSYTPSPPDSPSPPASPSSSTYTASTVTPWNNSRHRRKNSSSSSLSSLSSLESITEEEP